MVHLLALMLVVTQSQITINFGGSPCEAMLATKRDTYGFHPRSLSDAERKQKSAAMDVFWRLAKQQGPNGISCLKTMLKDEKEDRFFLFDGASLLYSLDSSPDSVAVVEDAIERSSFEDVDPAGYIRLVLALSKHGADVGPLALKYLTYPKVEAYVPLHAMKLDRVSGGAILFGSMTPAQEDRYMPQALSSKDVQVRDAAALLLAFNMTPESFQALRSAALLRSLSPATRKQVLDLTRRQPLPAMPPPKYTRAQVLKILRRIPHSKRQADALEPEYMKSMQKMESQLKGLKPGSKEYIAAAEKQMEDSEPFFGIAGAARFEQSAAQTLTAADLPELREDRRKSLEGVSDETLDEYFAYTQIILAVINRLDLYQDARQ